MRVSGKTDKGRKRSMNQDVFFTSDSPVGILPNLFIVADGMGGQNAGDIAARFCVERFTELVRFSKERTPIQTIEKAIRQTNEDLIAKAKNARELDGMGTTFVTATLEADNVLLVSNIGDSRLYLINERITQITQDHSLVAEMVRRGGLKPEEARNHPDKNIITRAVGAEDLLIVDFFRETLTDGDILLLCSDGLTNMLTDQEIARIVFSFRSLEEAADRLIFEANMAGGKDNISVILINPFDTGRWPV